MKRLIALCLLPLLLVLGFYAAWPAWTGYRISTALKAGDTATLDSKIVFDDVRASLRLAAEHKIGEVYDAYQARAGGAGTIISQIKADVVPRVADIALKSLVTSENLIRLARAKGTLKEGAERILQERVTKIGLPGLQGTGSLQGDAETGSSPPGGIRLPGRLAGLADRIPGLGGIARQQGDARQTTPPTAEVATEATTRPNYGIANIKHLGVLGPLGFEIGIAKDAGAKLADVVVEMRFVNGDWRVTGVRPRI